MSVSYRKTITPQAVDRDGICLSQTISGTDDLLLNGTLVSGGVATFTNPTHVSVYSTSNLSAVTFTITGTDRYGMALTEAIAGPNNGTVLTTMDFSTVINVQRSHSVAATIEVGAGNGFSSPWVPLDFKTGSFSAAVAVDLSAGASLAYTIEYTNEPVLAVGEQGVTKVWPSPVQNATADDEVALTSPACAVRVSFSSYVSGAATITVLQSQD